MRLEARAAAGALLLQLPEAKSFLVAPQDRSDQRKGR